TSPEPQRPARLRPSKAPRRRLPSPRRKLQPSQQRRRTKPLVTSRADDVRRIVDAAAFAADRHRDQRRKDADATPYINHPLQLANVLQGEGDGEDVRTISACI